MTKHINDKTCPPSLKASGQLTKFFDNFVCTISSIYILFGQNHSISCCSHYNPRQLRKSSTPAPLSPDSSFLTSSLSNISNETIAENGYEVPDDEFDERGRDAILSATPTRFYSFGETWPIPSPSPPPTPAHNQPEDQHVVPKTYKSEATIQLINTPELEMLEQVLPVTKL